MQHDGEQSKLSAGISKKREIARQLAEAPINLAPLDIEVDVDDGYRLPFDQIPALGVAFASLPETFRTVTGTVSVPKLLYATDSLGNPLDPSVLQRFNDGSGLLGSFRDSAKGFGQARLHAADAGNISSVATVPFDPTVLFMAMALNQINKKLDAIQETQEEMFDYIRQKDKASLRGNIKTLTDILNGYYHNWDNDIWCKNAHMKVVDIKQESDKDIVHLRTQITGKLGQKGLVEIRQSVVRRMEEVLDRLKEYQIAVYIYSFASFLEPLLSESFNEDYLSAVALGISEESIRYRELYTACYDAIEESANGSVDAKLLDGLSFAGKKLGAAVAATSIGERTGIDEALDEAGKGLGRLNDDHSNRLAEKLHQAKSPDVLPFKEGIESVNALYNQPMRLLADSDSIYLIPSE